MRENSRKRKKKMTFPESSLFSLLPFFFLLPLHGSFGQNLINDTCQTVAKEDPNVQLNFCITSLQAYPSSHCATLKGLGSISILLTQKNVTDTRSYIKQVMKNGKLNPDIRVRLDDCFELYTDAIASIKLAMKYYKSQRYYDANMQISSVMDATDTCEDGFMEKKGLVSPLTTRNKETFELSAMVLSIMHILQSGLNSS